jgi:hypothetical protein
LPWAGKDVVYNETFSFDKQIHEASLQVLVYDKDTISDDFLGEGSLALHHLKLEHLKGRPAGKVYLQFSRISTY